MRCWNEGFGQFEWPTGCKNRQKISRIVANYLAMEKSHAFYPPMKNVKGAEAPSQFKFT